GVGTGINGLPYAVNMGASVGMTGMNMTMDKTTVSMTSLTEKQGNEPVDNFTLTAQEVKMDGQTVWTYNGKLPGTELRVIQGDRIKIKLINHLSVATSIHWHGIRLPNAEDGVAGITQDAV